MILVQMTAAMLTAAVAEAQAKAKAEGKGFFGIMKDQLSAQFGYAVRYETMNPDTALAETPGNLAVANDRITRDQSETQRYRLRRHGLHGVQDVGIQSADGTFEYLMAEDDRYVEPAQTGLWRPGAHAARVFPGGWHPDQILLIFFSIER